MKLPNANYNEAQLLEGLQLGVDKHLSSVMCTTLQSLLTEIQQLVFKRSRQNWPMICFSLMLMLLAAESLQVDIYVHANDEHRFEEGCQAMQMNGIYVVVELFLAGTNRFSPLILDWDLAENKELLEGDAELIRAVHGLQLLSQSYCERPSET